jgi:hypothetical protein
MSRPTFVGQDVMDTHTHSETELYQEFSITGSRASPEHSRGNVDMGRT